MTIRTATVGDAADIARIHVDTWRAAYAGIVPAGYLSRLSREDRERRWTRTLSASTHGTRVATRDGEVVGWTSFGPSRDEDGNGIGELYAIYLDHAHWGTGLGRALVEDALSQLQDLGFAIITLWVLEENRRTRAIYERMEFAPDGATKTIALDGKELRELRYRRAM